MTDSRPSSKYYSSCRPHNTLLRWLSVQLNSFCFEIHEYRIHAAWCKSCQRVGLKFKKLAVDYGDYVQDGKALEGNIRCAHIEFAVGVTSHFIHEQLQVKSLPTLQLYKGTQKLWQASGHQAIKVMEAEVKRLLSMSPQDLQEYVDDLEDDGVLEEAMEESFFDNAYVD
jgi:hypothetical protein